MVKSPTQGPLAGKGPSWDKNPGLPVGNAAAVSSRPAAGWDTHPQGGAGQGPAQPSPHHPPPALFSEAEKPSPSSPRHAFPAPPSPAAGPPKQRLLRRTEGRASNGKLKGTGKCLIDAFVPNNFHTSKGLL